MTAPVLSDDDSEGFKDSSASSLSSSSEDSNIDSLDFSSDERLLDYVFENTQTFAVFEAQLDLPAIQQALQRVSLKVAHLKVLRAQRNNHLLQQQIAKNKAYIKTTKAKLKKQNALSNNLKK